METLKSFIHIPYDRLSSNTLLVGREGCRKSRIALDYMKENINVLFLSKSYEQCYAKKLEFEKEDFKGQVYHSLSHKFFKLNNKEPIFKQQNNPFEQKHIDLIASSKIGKIPKKDHIDLNLNFICSVFSNLKLLSKNLPDNWLIFMDDISYDELSILIKYTPFLEKCNVEKITFSYNKRNFSYYIRPMENYVNFDVKQKIIYTTTEIITRKLCEKYIEPDVYIVNKEFVDGSNIYVFPTIMTRKGLDAILSLCINYYQTLAEFYYICDGNNQDLNHTIIKGSNDFLNKLLVVEISSPHVNEIFECFFQFDEEYSYNEIRILLMIDQFHQSVGRCSGYRIGDNDVYVIIEQQAYKSILKNVCYENINLMTKTAHINSFSNEKLVCRNSEYGSNSLMYHLYFLVKFTSSYLLRRNKTHSALYVLLSRNKNNLDTMFIERLMIGLNELRKICMKEEEKKEVDKCIVVINKLIQQGKK